MVLSGPLGSHLLTWANKALSPALHLESSFPSVRN